MRKLLVIYTLAFLIILGLNTNLMAQDEIDMEVDLNKDVYSYGEYYGIEFEITGDAVKNVKEILIKVPTGKKMRLRNSLRLNKVRFEALGMSYEKFNKRFPEGRYKIILFPRRYGRWIVDITHDFPQTPNITFPSDGATDVPLTPTITWDPLINITEIELTLKTLDGGDGGFGSIVSIDGSLPTDATFFTIPSSILLSNTQYKLRLGAELDDGRANDLRSNRFIYFTTAAE